MTRRAEGWMRKAEVIAIVLAAVALLLGYLYSRLVG